jgi:hypothetical protein
VRTPSINSAPEDVRPSEKSVYFNETTKRFFQKAVFLLREMEIVDHPDYFYEQSTLL